MENIQKIPLALLLCVLLLHPAIAQKPYVATGRASYYANKFNGRLTANGEIFSNRAMTAAHRTLPFGTWLRVTNPKNNKSVIVRVNDRGPYVKGRIIDLTRTAADSLGIIHSGWATVEVEELKEYPEEKKEITFQPLVDPYQLNFPADWLGQWEGILKVFTSRGLEKNVTMQLNILPTAVPGRYDWTIIYDSIPRPYELVVRDSANGSYSLDEKNGIDIMSHVLGNHFLSRFSVDGVMLDCEYNLLNRDEMTFEIRSGNDERHWSTGNVVLQGDSVPEVTVFNVSNLQTALLQRMKK